MSGQVTNYLTTKNSKSKRNQSLLFQEILHTRVKSHLARFPTNWTVCELMSHIVDGLAHTPDAIDHVRRGKQFLNLPSFLNWLTAPINCWLSKWNARGQTRQTVLARYDAAHQALLNKLERIRDDEWSRGAPCYGEGYKTVLDLCVLPNRHLQEHAAQVARSQ